MRRLRLQYMPQHRRDEVVMDGGPRVEVVDGEERARDNERRSEDGASDGSRW